MTARATDTLSVLLLQREAQDSYLALLSERMPSLDVRTLDEKDTRPLPDIWLGSPVEAVEWLRQGRKPTWLQLTWAGFAPLLEASLPRDYQATRAVSVFGHPMFEYVLYHLLEHERQACNYRDQQSRFVWNPTPAGSLARKTVLIVGLGSIGRYLAKQMALLGLNVLGVQRSPRPHQQLQLVAGLERLGELAGRADYVINVLPDTPATRDLYDRNFFLGMKRTGLFINVGRGSAVVDADLVAALEQRTIAGAVLDVFRREPLPPSHQFWVTPGLTVTPHVAGPTDPERMVELFLHNLSLYRTGEPMQGMIDFHCDY